MKLEDRMKRSITQRESVVVLRSDFARMGSDSQVGRVLARFVAQGTLVRVSKGAFAKTRINKFTGKPTPAGTLEMIAAELFRKLKISLEPSSLVSEYNSGRSTQIPMGATVSTGRRRISRKVTVGNSTLTYEKNSRRAQV
ncbi:TPA: S-adenosylhomocysteine hydrolase [Pseudomonas putida]|nr:S-adenosylhomocysteine hydrolase [Pseudomonas putida]